MTSYNTSSGTDVLNEIKYAYSTTYGKLTHSYQDHADTAGSGDPNVLYLSDATAISNIYSSALRYYRVEYPNDARLGFERGHVSASGDSDIIDDRLHRVTGLEWDADGVGSTHSNVDEVRYAYNGTSRQAKVDYLEPEVRRETFNINSGGANNYNGWDRFGRTVDQPWDKYNAGAGSLDRVIYTYDFVGNRLTRNPRPSAIFQTESLTYDELNRLGTFEKQGGTATPVHKQQWSLDQLGNWGEFDDDDDGDGNWDLEQVRYHNAANEIDGNSGNPITEGSGQPVWASPTHDKAGNMTEIPRPAALSEKYELKWDAWNRLVSVSYDNGNSLNEVQTNRYDGLNRRIVRITRDHNTASIQETRHFYYNQQWQVLEERVGTVAATARIDKQYVYHPNYVDAIAVRFWDEDELTTNGLETAHYYLQDANFNVTAVTDWSGTVVERYNYTPYGEVTIMDANFADDADGKSDIDNELLYTGRRIDPETGLQLNRNRFYAAHLGRWASRDPIGYLGGTFNLYEYVGAQPTRLTDPSGEIAPAIIWGIEIAIGLLGSGGCRRPAAAPAPLPPCGLINDNSMENDGPGSMPVPPGGWDLDNIDQCYGGCQRCNPVELTGQYRGECGNCCEACAAEHKPLCNKNPKHKNCVGRLAVNLRRAACSNGCGGY